MKLIFIMKNNERPDRKRTDGEQNEGKVCARGTFISQIYGFGMPRRWNATRRIPETKSYRSSQMRGNSLVIGRLPDNNPSRRSRASADGTRGSEIVNRRDSLCNCDRIEAAVSRETMARDNGENADVIKHRGVIR